MAREARAERVVVPRDGTDKVRDGDSQQFFVQDAEQLLAIETHVINAARPNLKYEGFSAACAADIVLPMMKRQEREGSPL